MAKASSDFCCDCLGRVFHDAPNILHFGNKGAGDLLRPGMCFTIEPVATGASIR